ncbi:DUF2235 domain-containing protein, partial [Mesorhizobium ciceri]
LLPKRVKWREWKRRSLFGLYLPCGEPRRLPEDLNIHPSVEERRSRLAGYRPVNVRFPGDGPARPAKP